MIKSLILTVVSLQLCYTIVAQTATNFVANDCSGTSHELFAELDSGKIIVICWVMPCASCTGPALTGYNIVKSYQTEYPGKVLYYLVDDFADTDCSSLHSWANSKNIPANNFSFRFVNSSINMLDYGDGGMPKVVVIGGGASHKVVFNQNDFIDADKLNIAVEQALWPTGIKDPGASNFKFTAFPNPSKDEVSVTLTSAKREKVIVQVLNLYGAVVLESDPMLERGENTIHLETSALSNGIYFIRLKGADSTVSKLVISR